MCKKALRGVYVRLYSYGYAIFIYKGSNVVSGYVLRRMQGDRAIVRSGREDGAYLRRYFSVRNPSQHRGHRREDRETALPYALYPLENDGERGRHDEKARRQNTALVYYKYTDDILDGDKGRGKRLWFVSGHKKTVRNYPEIERIVRENLAAQQETEKSKTDSLDRAADASANMMAELSDYLLEDKKTPYTHDLFYAVGKWIYLIDALDDYDKDKKKGAYNPFVLSYSCEDKADLMKRRQKDVEFVFHSLFFDIRENLSKIKFHFNRDLSDNILLRGLPSETKRVMCSAACKRCKDAPPKETKGAD